MCLCPTHYMSALVGCARKITLTTQKSWQLSFIPHSHGISHPASDVLFILETRLKSSPHLRPVILMTEERTMTKPHNAS